MWEPQRLTTLLAFTACYRDSVTFFTFTDDMLPAFTMVQQIMRELSGAATDKEKVAVITKAMLRLLKNNANNSS
jgi:hypothetical protein